MFYGFTQLIEDFSGAQLIFAISTFEHEAPTHARALVGCKHSDVKDRVFYASSLISAEDDLAKAMAELDRRTA